MSEVRMCIHGRTEKQKCALYKNDPEQVHPHTKVLGKVLGFLKNCCPDVCMCGDSMLNHSTYSNHAPISEYHNYVDEIISDIESALGGGIDE